MLTTAKIQNTESSENNVLEVFKDIVGYEGIYQVSNLGRVKSLERQSLNRVLKERYLKSNRDIHGYLVVRFFRTNKSARIASLELGLNQMCITRVISGKRNHHKGYTFKLKK
jgi:hypothetical protein